MKSLLLLVACLQAEPLKPGNHSQKLTVDGVERTYQLHVPPQYDAARPTPLVLCFHGALAEGKLNVWFTNINKKSDAAGFLLVHPNGVLKTWKSGGFPAAIERVRPDDVAFVRRLLDDVSKLVNVDPKRIFATGMSNGGMMSHRLGVELSDRIAAIAPVAGGMNLDDPQPKRPMPVLYIHGTEDKIVPWNGSEADKLKMFRFRSVLETVAFWTKHNGCPDRPLVEQLPDKADDGTTVTRYTYPAGPNGAEVVLIKVEGGGHTWPGRDIGLEKFLGRTTKDVDANDLIWEFFEKHPLP